MYYTIIKKSKNGDVLDIMKKITEDEEILMVSNDLRELDSETASKFIKKMENEFNGGKPSVVMKLDE